MKLTKKNYVDQNQFNKKFQQNNKKKQQTVDTVLPSQQNIILLPHKQNIEYIILNIRDMIFIIIEMLENQKNPIPYIFSSDRRIFIFSLLLIIFGTLMLLLASLMKSPNNNY